MRIQMFLRCLYFGSSSASNCLPPVIGRVLVACSGVRRYVRLVGMARTIGNHTIKQKRKVRWIIHNRVPRQVLPISNARAIISYLQHCPVTSNNPLAGCSVDGNLEADSLLSRDRVTIRHVSFRGLHIFR
ncbi:hypothetical protein BDV33DRAFT_172576, partial [Aspergillus novoparasiticus]